MTGAKSQNEQLPNASYKQTLQQTSVGARHQQEQENKAWEGEARLWEGGMKLSLTGKTQISQKMEEEQFM